MKHLFPSGFAIALALLAGATAHAQSWNLYTTNPATGQAFIAGPTIAFADGAMSASQGATVSLSVGNLVDRKFTMDTGSNGILVSQDLYNGVGGTYLGPGTETLTSSGIIYNGDLYQTNVAINSGGAVAATSNVTVLRVTSIACSPGARSCTPSNNPTGVTYMGIGFNRGVSTVTPAAGNPTTGIKTNVFNNVVSLGPTGTSAENLAPGYIITNSGVTLGLTTAGTAGYAFVKLTPDGSPSPNTQAGTVWNQAPAGVTVGGFSGNGTILPDSGIDYAFLTPPVSFDPVTCPTTPPGGSTCLSPTVTVDVFLPGQPGALASYTLTQAGGVMTPASISLNKGSPTTFLNTGRLFYQGFDYLFDPTNGFVGYRSVDSQASVTEGVALSGSFSTAHGFANGYATFLYGDTTILQTGSGVFSGVISGPGSFTVGSGTVTLTAANTYSGGTGVGAGARLVGTTTSLRGAIANNGNVTFDQATAGTYAGSMSGSGSVTLQGGGAYTFSGTNSYTGGTTVAAGSSLTGTTNSLQGNIVNNGAVTFDQATNGTYAGNMSGSGSLALTGGGLVTFTGINTLTGPLTLTNTTLQGTTSSLPSTIVNNGGTVAFNQPGSGTYGGAISGTGGVSVSGGGAVSLTGAHTYTGPTSVTGALLSVNGSIASNVTVGAGGALGGSGTINGNAAVNGNGALAPGNSIGTLTVAGNLAVAAGSTFQVEVDAAGQSDRIVVGGTATLAGGTVVVSPQPGTYPLRNSYTILTAAGGVSGTYAAATTNMPFLQASLAYGANNVTLTTVPGGFAATAATPLQASVGAALDAGVAGAGGDFATVLGALAYNTFTATQGQYALQALSGNNYAGFSSSMVQGAALFMNNFAGMAGGGTQGNNRVALAEACEVACDAGPARPAWGAWGGGLGGLGSIGGQAPVGAVTYNAGGFAAGLDRALSETFRLGVTAGYTAGTQWVSGFAGQGRTDTVQAGLYGNWAQGPAYVDGLAGYAYSGNQMWRQILLPGLGARTALGQTGANQWFGQLEGGYRVEAGTAAKAYVTPFARLQAYTGTQNAFTETGAQSLNLTIAQQTTNSLRSVLGATLGAAVDLGWREKLALSFKLGWSHEYADVSRPVTAALAGAPASPFTTFGIAPTRDGALLGFGANTAIAEATSVYLRYEGIVAGQDSTHAFTAGLRMTW